MKSIKPFKTGATVNGSGLTKTERYYKLGDRTFMIRYENSNGSPLGFNSKMCLRQYDPAKGCWNNLEDIKCLDMSTKIPNYFSEHESRRHMNEFVAKMEKHMVEVYS